MPRPWKHPKAGVYWLRKRVPDDLRHLVGKREEKRSLKTKDAAEAKRCLLQALSELELRWANLREGPRSLSERAAREIAQAVYDWWINTYRENPRSQISWYTTSSERWKLKEGDFAMSSPQLSILGYLCSWAYPFAILINGGLLRAIWHKSAKSVHAPRRPGYRKAKSAGLLLFQMRVTSLVRVGSGTDLLAVPIDW
jgi:hypothetical protein